MKEMEIRIENVQSLVVAAVRATREFGDVSIWWRGHSVSTWVLRPLVYRVEDAGHQYERNIASRFIQRAAVRHRDTPPSNDLAGWNRSGVRSFRIQASRYSSSRSKEGIH